MGNAQSVKKVAHSQKRIAESVKTAYPGWPREAVTRLKRVKSVYPKVSKGPRWVKSVYPKVSRVSNVGRVEAKKKVKRVAKL